MENIIKSYCDHIIAFDKAKDAANTWGDQFWGTVNGKGANFLGHILMETREILKNCFLEGEKS